MEVGAMVIAFSGAAFASGSRFSQTVEYFSKPLICFWQSSPVGCLHTYPGSDDEIEWRM
jgi:hypothetical protein